MKFKLSLFQCFTILTSTLLWYLVPCPQFQGCMRLWFMQLCLWTNTCPNTSVSCFFPPFSSSTPFSCQMKQTTLSLLPWNLMLAHRMWVQATSLNNNIPPFIYVLIKNVFCQSLEGQLQYPLIPSDIFLLLPPVIPSNIKSVQMLLILFFRKFQISWRPLLQKYLRCSLTAEREGRRKEYC